MLAKVMMAIRVLGYSSVSCALVNCLNVSLVFVASINITIRLNDVLTAAVQHPSS